MDLGSSLAGNMLIGELAVGDMDHLSPSYVAGRMASWLLWTAESGYFISPLVDPFAWSMRIIDLYYA